MTVHPTVVEIFHAQSGETDQMTDRSIAVAKNGFTSFHFVCELVGL